MWSHWNLIKSIFALERQWTVNTCMKHRWKPLSHIGQLSVHALSVSCRHASARPRVNVMSLPPRQCPTAHVKIKLLIEGHCTMLKMSLLYLNMINKCKFFNFLTFAKLQFCNFWAQKISNDCQSCLAAILKLWKLSLFQWGQKVCQWIPRYQKPI